MQQVFIYKVKNKKRNEEFSSVAFFFFCLRGSTWLPLYSTYLSYAFNIMQP